MGDPGDPSVWFLGMLRAVAGLQRRETEPARDYLRFVEAHRGRPVADQASLRLRRLVSSPKFAQAWRLVDDYVAGRKLGDYGPPAASGRR